MKGWLARHWPWAVAASGVVLAVVGALPVGMGAALGLLLVMMAAGHWLLAVRRRSLRTGARKCVVAKVQHNGGRA